MTLTTIAVKKLSIVSNNWFIYIAIMNVYRAQIVPTAQHRRQGHMLHLQFACINVRFSFDNLQM